MPACDAGDPGSIPAETNLCLSSRVLEDIDDLVKSLCSGHPDVICMNDSGKSKKSMYESNTFIVKGPNSCLDSYLGRVPACDEGDPWRQT